MLLALLSLFVSETCLDHGLVLVMQSSACVMFECPSCRGKFVFICKFVFNDGEGWEYKAAAADFSCPEPSS